MGYGHAKNQVAKTSKNTTDSPIVLYAFIDTKRPKRTVALEYCTQRGAPCWRVNFDSHGAIVGYEKGAMYDDISGDTR